MGLFRSNPCYSGSPCWKRAASLPVSFTSAGVSLDGDAAGTVTLRVEDDGQGMATQGLRPRHYALGIIEERTQSLGGMTGVGPRAGGGTPVVLVFTPISVKQGISVRKTGSLDG